jgi:glycerol-3-phosphate dehydrogenase
MNRKRGSPEPTPRNPQGDPEEDCLRTQVVIIGAGVTGLGLARDLALRGISCLIVEQGDVNSGASGRNHGLLHSGSRYVSSDTEVAAECLEEADLLKQLAPQCVEETGGLFVAVEGDDENFIADFPSLCEKADIPANPLDIREAREMEPCLSNRVIAAYEVPDATVDPFKLALQNFHQAHQNGTQLLRHHKVVGFKRHGRRLKSAHLVNTETGDAVFVEADQFVSAAGAWCAEVARMAGADMDMVYSKGTLTVTHARLSERVINRLRKPADGDILVPGGTVSIFGTTSSRMDVPADVRPTVREVDRLVSEAGAMIPKMETVRYIRAYAGIRPLIRTLNDAEDRSVSRGFILVDHAGDGIENFLTISGGKLTTYRLMAERTADRVCERLGVCGPCRTRDVPLPTDPAWEWTEPGLAPREWIKHPDHEDPLLCECEMIPASVIDSVIGSIRSQGGRPSLKAVGLRTRMGKGACQGSFCGARVTGHLCDRGELSGRDGQAELKQFLQERWKGERTILWGGQLVQSELKEAVYSGFLGLEG